MPCSDAAEAVGGAPRGPSAAPSSIRCADGLCMLRNVCLDDARQRASLNIASKYSIDNLNIAACASTTPGNAHR